ncbi:protein NTM1-like 9 isoform X2 [Neltuma alba]|uniref:protein NTM1-like 9 isoform X2 n=1 Tax=Neltuma alba TaxID=207710 RepID=UPI0010A418CC|nr:protein NTM1-like 9 isoform X2 [Prosopis alba]
MVDQADTLMPKGLKFRPTDEELVGHYLHHKLMADDPSIHNIIPEIEVCKYEPWDLPALSPIKSEDSEWFFFSPRDYKYSNSTRCNRATSRGYWKPTGKERKIRDRVTNKVIGTKKTLVFYRGRVPGVKDNWVIHEYHDALFPPDQRAYVVCRLLKKTEKKTKEKSNELVHDEQEPNNRIVVEYENQASLRVIPEYSLSDMDPLIQTAGESNELAGSMIQTGPTEMNPSVETPHDESEEEFDFSSLLRSPPSLPPSLDEQESNWKW